MSEKKETTQAAQPPPEKKFSVKVMCAPRSADLPQNFRAIGRSFDAGTTTQLTVTQSELEKLKEKASMLHVEVLGEATDVRMAHDPAEGEEEDPPKDPPKAGQPPKPPALPPRPPLHGKG